MRALSKPITSFMTSMVLLLCLSGLIGSGCSSSPAKSTRTAASAEEPQSNDDQGIEVASGPVIISGTNLVFEKAVPDCHSDANRDVTCFAGNKAEDGKITRATFLPPRLGVKWTAKSEAAKLLACGNFIDTLSLSCRANGQVINGDVIFSLSLVLDGQSREVDSDALSLSSGNGAVSDGSSYVIFITTVTINSAGRTYLDGVCSSDPNTHQSSDSLYNIGYDSFRALVATSDNEGLQAFNPNAELLYPKKVGGAISLVHSGTTLGAFWQQGQAGQLSPNDGAGQHLMSPTILTGLKYDVALQRYAYDSPEFNCSDWRVLSGYAAVGTPSPGIEGSWLYTGTPVTCNDQRQVYCLAKKGAF